MLTPHQREIAIREYRTQYMEQVPQIPIEIVGEIVTLPAVPKLPFYRYMAMLQTLGDYKIEVEKYIPLLAQKVNSPPYQAEDIVITAVANKKAQETEKTVEEILPQIIPEIKNAIARNETKIIEEIQGLCTFCSAPMVSIKVLPHSSIAILEHFTGIRVEEAPPNIVACPYLHVLAIYDVDRLGRPRYRYLDWRKIKRYIREIARPITPPLPTAAIARALMEFGGIYRVPTPRDLIAQARKLYGEEVAKELEEYYKKRFML